MDRHTTMITLIIIRIMDTPATLTLMAQGLASVSHSETEAGITMGAGITTAATAIGIGDNPKGGDRPWKSVGGQRPLVIPYFAIIPIIDLE